MIRFARDFRLVPIVLLATVCLFALKVSGLVFDGGYTLAERLQNRAKPKIETTTAEDVPAYPKITIADANDAGRRAIALAAGARRAQEMFGITTLTRRHHRFDQEEEAPPAAPAALTTSEKAPEPASRAGTPSAGPGKSIRPAARRARAAAGSPSGTGKHPRSEMRENLLKAAEKRVEAKVPNSRRSKPGHAAIGVRDKTKPTASRAS